MGNRRKNPWADYVPPDPNHNRADAPELVPIFGVKPFGADTTCADIHPGGPIPRGSRCCCMACHKSGVEHRVASHTKPGNGQIREGYDQPTPTVYVPPPPRPGSKSALVGGLGRVGALRDKRATPR